MLRNSNLGSSILGQIAVELINLHYPPQILLVPLALRILLQVQFCSCGLLLLRWVCYFSVTKHHVVNTIFHWLVLQKSEIWGENSKWKFDLQT